MLAVDSAVDKAVEDPEVRGIKPLPVWMTCG
jgi:hypothetical protein